jgi:hypothetical protein
MEHEFKVGQAVEYQPASLALCAARNVRCDITSTCEGGEFKYHIKDLKEIHERVAQEASWARCESWRAGMIGEMLIDALRRLGGSAADPPFWSRGGSCPRRQLLGGRALHAHHRITGSLFLATLCFQVPKFWIPCSAAMLLSTALSRSRPDSCTKSAAMPVSTADAATSKV